MTNRKNQTLVEHIEALRTMLRRCIVAVVVAFPIAMAVVWPGIWRLIDWLFPPEFRTLYYGGNMVGAFMMQMKCALVLAMVATSPYTLWEVWKFVAPGLREQERQAIRQWVGWAAVLFAAGVALCAGFVMPLVWRFFLGFQSERLQALPDLAKVVDMTLGVSLAFGVMFQFPIFLLMLVRFGVVRVAALAHARPYIVVGILIVATLLTPPDVLSQIALAVPSWLLFEATLLIARRFERRAQEAEKIAEAEAEANDYGLDIYMNEK